MCWNSSSIYLQPNEMSAYFQMWKYPQIAQNLKLEIPKPNQVEMY